MNLKPNLKLGSQAVLLVLILFGCLLYFCAMLKNSYFRHWPLSSIYMHISQFFFCQQEFCQKSLKLSKRSEPIQHFYLLPILQCSLPLTLFYMTKFTLLAFLCMCEIHHFGCCLYPSCFFSLFSVVITDWFVLSIPRSLNFMLRNINVLFGTFKDQTVGYF